MDRYPEAYLDYLRYFHGVRDFFECHEVLEEYWKREPKCAESDIWVGLIQLAVGLYHERRGNTAGASKMLRSAAVRLNSSDLEAVGINKEQLLDRLNRRLAGIGSYVPEFDIPVTDPKLLQWIEEAKQENFDPSVIHKHTERDRSDVIVAREEALRRKAAARQDRRSTMDKSE